MLFVKWGPRTKAKLFVDNLERPTKVRVVAPSPNWHLITHYPIFLCTLSFKEAFFPPRGSPIYYFLGFEREPSPFQWGDESEQFTFVLGTITIGKYTLTLTDNGTCVAMGDICSNQSTITEVENLEKAIEKCVFCEKCGAYD